MMVYTKLNATKGKKHPRMYEVSYRYGKSPKDFGGTELICMGRGENGILFTGDKANPKNRREQPQWIFVDRGHIRASNEKLLKEPLSQDAQRLYVSNDHMGNWRDCLRSRKMPICDVSIGFHSVIVCHLG